MWIWSVQGNVAHWHCHWSLTYKYNLLWRHKQRSWIKKRIMCHRISAASSKPYLWRQSKSFVLVISTQHEHFSDCVFFFHWYRTLDKVLDVTEHDTLCFVTSRCRLCDTFVEVSQFFLWSLFDISMAPHLAVITLLKACNLQEKHWAVKLKMMMSWCLCLLKSLEGTIFLVFIFLT